MLDPIHVDIAAAYAAALGSISLAAYVKPESQPEAKRNTAFRDEVQSYWAHMAVGMAFLAMALLLPRHGSAKVAKWLIGAIAINMGICLTATGLDLKRWKTTHNRFPGAGMLGGLVDITLLIRTVVRFVHRHHQVLFWANYAALAITIVSTAVMVNFWFNRAQRRKPPGLHRVQPP